MKSKLKKYIKEFLSFAVILFVLSSGLSLYRSSQMEIRDEVCRDGADIVYFWGAWCPVCKVTSPNIDSFASKYKIATIAVKSGSDEEIAAYKEKNSLRFAVENDNDAQLAKRYKIGIYPTTVFCKKGKVAFVETGYLSTFGIWLRLLFRSVF